MPVPIRPIPPHLTELSISTSIMPPAVAGVVLDAIVAASVHVIRLYRAVGAQEMAYLPTSRSWPSI